MPGSIEEVDRDFVSAVTLVCAGLEFWRRIARTDPDVLEGPGEFRTIVDALDEQDRRDDFR
jgi:hypothetical protein